ncbi:MAG TPA: asparagine synthase C-terminal domain-containing protein [Planctomycetota bacterium]
MASSSPDALATFLHFGYLPRVEADPRARSWSRVRPEDVLPDGALAREELVARGLAAFRAACGTPGEGLQVLPLSGGIDSRLILAHLRQAGLGPRLVTVTFGVPGTLDFDLAPAVARAAGVRHETIDLTDHPLTRAELLELARAAPWSFVLEVFYNHLPFRRFGRAAVYWSGSQANSLAGEDAHELDPDWARVCRSWARALPAARSLRLTPPGFAPESALPREPPLAGTRLTHAEQLFLMVRNPGRNDPAQLPRGYDVRTPFCQPAWVDFVLRLPTALRARAGLYQELARRSDPELFALPLKNDLGLPPGAPAWRHALRRNRARLERELRRRLPWLRLGTDPNLNYADLDAELRRASPLAALVEESLARLEDARTVPWLRPRELWTRHRRRRANLGDALVLLASLELNLAANGPPAWP